MTMQNCLKSYRSPLEKFTAEKLLENNISFLYEPKHILQEKFVFEGKVYEGKKGSEMKSSSPHVRAITYSPDFVCPNYQWILECKGHRRETFNIKWKMFKNLFNGKVPLMLMPRNRAQVLLCIDHIINLQNGIETVNS